MSMTEYEQTLIEHAERHAEWASGSGFPGTSEIAAAITAALDELALSVIITQAVAAVETGDMTGLTKILSLTGLLGGAES